MPPVKVDAYSKIKKLKSAIAAQGLSARGAQRLKAARISALKAQVAEAAKPVIDTKRVAQMMKERGIGKFRPTMQIVNHGTPFWPMPSYVKNAAGVDIGRKLARLVGNKRTKRLRGLLARLKAKGVSTYRKTKEMAARARKSAVALTGERV